MPASCIDHTCTSSRKSLHDLHQPAWSPSDHRRMADDMLHHEDIIPPGFVCRQKHGQQLGYPARCGAGCQEGLRSCTKQCATGACCMTIECTLFVFGGITLLRILTKRIMSITFNATENTAAP
eukprot:349907-Chlamydomonas_euryale.AAC.12